MNRRMDEYSRLMREHRTVVDPPPYFVERVIACLPARDGWMLAWAARRVLPVTLGLAAVLTAVIFATSGPASREAAVPSVSSTAPAASDPLDWLLENGRGVR